MAHSISRARPRTSAVLPGMMRDPAAGERAWTHFDGLYPARLGDGNVAGRPPPDILVMRGHGVRLGFNNQVRRPEFLGGLPLIGIRPLLGRRHVFRSEE